LYELFKLITEKIDQNLKQKLYTKAYYIICSLYSSTHVESNKIEFFILWFFCDLLWFFKHLDEINKKDKDKTTRGVIWPVLQSSGGKLDHFMVEGVN
jgi:hypothetical protein